MSLFRAPGFALRLALGPSARRGLAVLATLTTLAGCGGGGSYGFTRTYQALDAERAYEQRAVDASYEEVRRARPEEQPFVGWFGVVVAPPEIDGTTARVRLSLRAHQERHLCENEREDSCRVTVAARDAGTFTAVIAIRPEDAQEGTARLWTNSLVRVYGKSAGEVDAAGDPVIVAEYYRHWPNHTYVTTAAAARMRR